MSILENLDTLLITDPTNIRYLTGFVGVDPRDREAYVLVTQNTVYLFTNALYIESANKLKIDSRFKIQNLRVIEIGHDNPLSRALLSVIPANVGIQSAIKLGFEEVNLTVAEFNKLKQELANVTLVPTRNRVEELRQIKTKKEIALIRKASEITDACFDGILKKLKPGVTESDIAWEIETFFRRRNAENAFSPIVAFGKNSSMPHYNSSSYGASDNQGLALKSNDIVLLDFGARFNGYCSDMTRVVSIGKPKKEWIDAYTAVLEAQQKALDLLSAGIYNGATLDAATKEIIAESDLPPYPHSLGHNLGLDIHEAPRLSTKIEQVLKPNMVFTVEPGVYLAGKFGIRIEDTVVLTAQGVDVLTKSKKTIIVL